MVQLQLACQILRKDIGIIIDWFLKDWVVTPGATYLGIVAYLVMCAVIYTVACKVKKV